MDPNELVLAHLDLVPRITKHYRRLGRTDDELASDGHLGLILASRYFDPALSQDFPSYASRVIRQQIWYGFRESRAVSVPHWASRALGRWRRQSKGRPLTSQAAVEVLGLSPARAELLILAASLRRSELQDLEQEGTTDYLELRDTVEALQGLATPEDWDLLTMRYGLDGSTPVHLAELGKSMGMTHQGVSKREKQALRRLREAG